MKTPLFLRAFRGYSTTSRPLIERSYGASPLLSKPLQNLLPLINDQVHPRSLIDALSKAITQTSLAALPPDSLTHLIKLITPEYVRDYDNHNKQRFIRYERRIRAIVRNMAPHPLPMEAYHIILQACSQFGYAKATFNVFQQILSTYPDQINEQLMFTTIHGFVRKFRTFPQLRLDRTYLVDKPQASSSKDPTWIHKTNDLLANLPAVADKPRIQSSILQLMGLTDSPTAFSDRLKQSYNFDMEFPDTDVFSMQGSETTPLRLTGKDITTILSTIAATGNRRQVLTVFEAVRNPLPARVSSGVLCAEIQCPNGHSINPLITHSTYDILIDSFATRHKRRKANDHTSNVLGGYLFQLAVRDHVSSHSLLQSLIGKVGPNEKVPSLLHSQSNTRPSLMRISQRSVMWSTQSVYCRRSARAWKQHISEMEILDHELKSERVWLSQWLSDKKWKEDEEMTRVRLERHFNEIVSAEVGLSILLRRSRAKMFDRLVEQDINRYVHLEHQLKALRTKEFFLSKGNQHNLETLDREGIKDDDISICQEAELLAKIKMEYDPEDVIPRTRPSHPYDAVLFDQWTRWWQQLNLSLPEEHQIALPSISTPEMALRKHALEADDGSTYFSFSHQYAWPRQAPLIPSKPFDGSDPSVTLFNLHVFRRIIRWHRIWLHSQKRLNRDAAGLERFSNFYDARLGYTIWRQGLSAMTPLELKALPRWL